MLYTRYGHELLSLSAESVDLDFDDVADGEVGKPPGHRDPLRSARVDDVPGIQHEVPGQVPYQVPHVEDHVRSRGVLARLAVHPGAETEPLRVGHVVGGYDGGSQRVERLAAFAF